MTSNELGLWKGKLKEGDRVRFHYVDAKGNQSNVMGTIKVGYRRPSGTAVATRENPFKPYVVDGMSINTKTNEVFLDISDPTSDRDGSTPAVFKRYNIKRVSKLQVLDDGTDTRSSVQKDIDERGNDKKNKKKR